MANNKVKEIWASGKAVVNAWLAIPSGFSAEVMAQCGWDSVTVDMQHGVQDYQSMVACFQAMGQHPVTPLVRVPWNEPGIIGKVLDGGAWGVICPMVNNAAEAKALVSYALYPPKGKRSNGPIRAGAYGSATPYQKTANDEVLIIPMIETQEAIDNIDAIAGPFDQAILGDDDAESRQHLLAAIQALQHFTETLVDAAQALNIDLKFEE